VSLFYYGVLYSVLKLDFNNIFRRSSGIDLNCGCPKRDVRKEGYGSKLLEDPQLIADIVKQTRARISDPDFTISTKIRIKYPLEETIDLCKKVMLVLLFSN
jgi:tRNA-dihydrouridine synthase 4